MVTVRCVAAILFGLVALHVQADEIASRNLAWVTIEHADGLMVQIPAPATDKLVDQVRQLRSSLLDRQVALSETVEETRFDVADTLLSVILPGGLIYASYRKLSNDRAQARLANVTRELSDLSKGLLVLKAESGESILALVH